MASISVMASAMSPLPGTGMGFDPFFPPPGFLLLDEEGDLGRGHLGLVGPELGRSEVTGVDWVDLLLGF